MTHYWVLHRSLASVGRKAPGSTGRGYDPPIRSPRRHPVRSLIALVLAASALFTACSGDDDGPAVEKQDALGLAPDEIAGTCLLFPKDQTEIVKDLPKVPCEQPHSHEIYYVGDYVSPDVEKNDIYPGFDALEDFARTTCLTQFEIYVGVGAFDSQYFYTWLVPTLQSWNDTDKPDRQVICMLGGDDAEPLVGSKRKSES